MYMYVFIVRIMDTKSIYLKCMSIRGIAKAVIHKAHLVIAAVSYTIITTHSLKCGNARTVGTIVFVRNVMEKTCTNTIDKI